MLKAPFPYFGGKSRVSSSVWKAFGNVKNYVEPFFGSGAVLLGRPTPFSSVETVNDADGLLSNFWRAIKSDHAAVAEYANWPVNEADLHARHLWLIGQRDSLTERLMSSPDYYDVKAAGWWVWGACCWIGSGWCSGDGPWTSDGEKLVKMEDRQLPHVGTAGTGIHRKLPHVGNAGTGIHEWFSALSDRLRSVRVACGDWSRVTGPSVTYGHGMTAVFLDPPYGEGNVAYSVEDQSREVIEEVFDWAEIMGRRDDMRIILCGYEGRRQIPGWREIAWSSHGGYGSQGDGEGRENKHREVLWASPACLGMSEQGSLFQDRPRIS